MSTTGVPSIASNRTDKNRCSFYLFNGDWVKAQRVRAIRRTRGENTGQRKARIVPRVSLKHSAIGPVKERNEQESIAG